MAGKPVLISPAIDCFGQYLLHSIIKDFKVALLKIRHLCFRMYTRLEQYFIRVFIPDSCDNLLVHQCRFYHSSSSFKSLRKGVKIQVWIKSVRSHIIVADKSVRIFHQPYLSQFPLAAIRQVVAVVKSEEKPRIVWLLLFIFEIFWVTGHAKVKQQRVVITKIEEQVFAVAKYFREVLAGQAIGQF